MGCLLRALSLALVVASALSVPLRRSAQAHAHCQAEPDFVRFAVEGSCIHYYQCFSGHAYLMQCPDYHWFNDAEHTCDEEPAPLGCQAALPPVGPPEGPEEPQEPEEPDFPEEEQEPAEEPEEPIEEPDFPEEVEEQEPAEEPEEPIEEPDFSEETEELPEEIEPEESQEPEEPQEPVDEPEQPIDEPDAPIDTPDEPTEESEELQEPTEDPDELTDESEVPGEPEEDETHLEPPIEELIPPVEEGSGDPEEQNTDDSVISEEGSGFEGLKNFFTKRLGRSYSKSNDEASGDVPEFHDDLQSGEFIPLMSRNEIDQKPSIDPTFVLPDVEAKYK